MHLTHTINGGWIFTPAPIAGSHSILDTHEIRDCPVCSALEPVYVDQSEGREDPVLQCPVCSSEEVTEQRPDFGPSRVLRCQDCAWDYAD